MAGKQPVWGIDVGQCSLKAIKLQAIGPEEFELLDFDIVEHSDILSQTDEDPTDIVADAIRVFAERNDLRGCRLAVAVPGEQTLTKFTKMPPVEKKKIPDMVQYEASQQIPFDMDEVVWDYQVFGDTDGAEIEVGIFAIRKELIRNYLMLYTEVGLEPQLVQTSPIGSYNTARFEMPMPEGEAAVLLDMGAVATDLIIIDGERIWSRPVPIGGNKFTEALVSAFKINFKKAEKLKRNAASSKYARQIFQAMRPVFADLVSEVQRSIGFYTAAHRDSNVTKVIGMGNAFKLPGLQKFLQQNLQMDVEKLNTYKHLRITAIEKADEFQDNMMSLAVCYGLALQGAGIAAVDSSLLPIEFRRQILWKKKTPWFVGSAALLALAAGALWGSNTMAQGVIDGATDNPETPISQLNNYSDDTLAWNDIQRANNIEKAIDKAKVIGGAANRLKSSYGAANQTPKDIGTIRELAKYPAQNIYIPRILSVINEAIEATDSEATKRIETAEAYKQFARRVDRPQREEIWINQMRIIYSDTPEEISITKGDPNKRSRAGWLVQIKGITPKDKPAKWLEDVLGKNLEHYGRKPDMGIFVDVVRLGDVTARDDTAPDLAPPKVGGGAPSGRPGERQPGGGRPGPGRPRQPGGGRPGPAGGGGVPGRDAPGFGGGAGGDDAGGGLSPQDLVPFQKNDIDYLTDESIKTDSSFLVEVFIRKGDTPPDQVPDEFKPKTDDAAAGKNG